MYLRRGKLGLQDKMDVLVFVDKWVGGGGGILRKKAK
jgi:hypothetical protein